MGKTKEQREKAILGHAKAIFRELKELGLSPGGVKGLSGLDVCILHIDNHPYISVHNIIKKWSIGEYIPQESLEGLGIK